MILASSATSPHDPEREVHDVRLSKHLSRLLRHKALESGVQVDTEGWASVSDALRWANGMEVNAVVHRMEDVSNAVSWSEAEVCDMVYLNNKRRFELRESTAGLQIRATTKHTMFAVATPPPGTSSGPESEVHDVRLSKYLSRLLRHKALESGVQVDTEGWARVSDALRWANGMEVNAVVHRMEDASNAVNWSEADISDVVNLNNKRRFELRESTAGLQIRATTKHTMFEPTPAKAGSETGLVNSWSNTGGERDASFKKNKSSNRQFDC